MKLNYTFEGRAIPDFAVETFLYNNIDNEKMLNVSTENVILVALLFKIKKLMDLELFFNGISIGKVDDEGLTESCPDGFCDFNHRYSTLIKEKLNENLPVYVKRFYGI